MPPLLDTLRLMLFREHEITNPFSKFKCNNSCMDTCLHWGSLVASQKLYVQVPVILAKGKFSGKISRVQRLNEQAGEGGFL